MTKKIMILLLSLPIFLIFSLFFTTKTVSLAIDISVSDIKINGDKFIYLNLDEAEKYHVDYTVYPTNAKNKEITFFSEAIEGFEFSQLEFINGYIVPKSVGMAKVFLRTIDGGYQDSIVVQVDSTLLQRIDSNVEKEQIYTGEKQTIFTNFIPKTANNQMLIYRSNNEEVATVDERGVITALRKGEAMITILSAYNANIKDEIKIQVLNKEAMDLSTDNIVCLNDGKIDISIDDDKIPYTITYRLLDKYRNELADHLVSAKLSNDLTSLNFVFLEANYYEEIIIEITYVSSLGIEVCKECKVLRVGDFEVAFDNELESCKVGNQIGICFQVFPKNEKLNYEVFVDENASVQMLDNVIVFNALNAGISTVTLKVLSAFDNGIFKEIQTQVAIAPTVFNIKETGNIYGMEEIWTIGKYGADNNLSEIVLNPYTKEEIETFDDSFRENLVWKCDVDNSQVSIDNNGKINLIDEHFSDIVHFSLAFEYKGKVIVETPQLAIHCIGNGVNVDNCLDLLKASNNNKIVILQDHIVKDFGIDAYGKMVYKLVDTTYDKTYYENLGIANQAKVKVLLEFRNDLYGNGFMINADKVTTKLDSTGKSDEIENLEGYFEGPLDFVTMKPTEISSISVKAQDNICFAVYDDVTIRNVDLRGCDLVANNSNSYDLLDLNYVGTTLEVLGDNVNILYSRISNGRTAVRVFGSIDSNQPIKVNICNCILSNAREFILKIGTNAFMESSKQLTADDVIIQKEYAQLTQEQKILYDQKYIKTFVNVSNTALRNSGLFSIGIDAHFSGVLLEKGEELTSGLLKGWCNLAKTSYGAKLTFENEVRIYDWKDINNVDSSSLIEMKGIDDKSPFAALKFDIKEMIKKISVEKRFEDILVPYDGKKYVHGGIAFFGGGVNYGVFEQKAKTSFNFAAYQIGLDDVGKDVLKLAAGDYPFYFMMYNNKSIFTPELQNQYLSANDEAFRFVYK